VELRQLRYFAAVARHLHFARAAEETYVTQSALSQQIARLECELGLSLLNRPPGQAVTLTPAGEELLAHAEALLLGAAEARAAMDGHTGVRRGVARVAATVADAPWLAEVLIAFHGEHPGVQLELRQGSAAEVLALLCRGDVDIAVCALRAEHDRKLDVTLLSDAPLVAILAPEHPRATAARWLSPTCAVSRLSLPSAPRRCARRSRPHVRALGSAHCLASRWATPRPSARSSLPDSAWRSFPLRGCASWARPWPSPGSPTPPGTASRL